MEVSETVENSGTSKRPSNSALTQQRLSAWQPSFSPYFIISTFFIIGIAFIPTGITLLYFSNKISEHIIDYTHCLDVSQFPNNVTCSSQLGSESTDTCICSIPFQLDEDFNGDVFMYYGLSNFYQNHRRYGRSKDKDQLLGILSQKPSDDCGKLRYDGDNEKTSNPIAPCGAIANSMFSDTLNIKWKSKDNEIAIPLLKYGIAWPSDKINKFLNPNDLSEELRQLGYVKPLAWKRNLDELDQENESNNGFQNEDFIVWMRTAALPNFRKLYRLIDHSTESFKGLKQGNYTLEVEYMYPVTAFNGRKQMILSTMSALGGKNPFLGIAYIVVGCVCLLMCFIFLFIHIKYTGHTK